MSDRLRKRKIGKFFSRSLWVNKLLRLESFAAAPLAEQGAILLQIDGLAYKQLQHALARGRMPFIKSILRRGDFVLTDFYAGIPSTTPAIQAEIIYGKKAAVPAFQYYDRIRQRISTMYEADSVQQVAAELSKEGDGLLKGGSSYANVYAGDAATARFCAQTITMQSLLRQLHPLRLLLIFLLHFATVFRIIGLLLLELLLAITDFVTGASVDKHLLTELKFIPARVAVCIFLRELTRFCVKMDIARDVPVIMTTFLGYDEQSHRRGPASGMAHWSLKGLDAVIKDIYCTTRRHEGRQYKLVIYADHGQEQTQSYQDVYGRSIEDGIAAALLTGRLEGLSIHENSGYINLPMLYQRARAMVHPTPSQAAASYMADEGGIKVTAMGPLGHLYIPMTLSLADREYYAKRLQEIADIPLVLTTDGRDGALAFTADGIYRLPQEAETLFGAEHPFLPHLAEDLTHLVHHPHAGDFVISGWRRNGPYITFPAEGGSHAGPGKEEIHSFALFPAGTVPEEDPIRPLSIRHWVQKVRGTTRDRQEAVCDPCPKPL